MIASCRFVFNTFEGMLRKHWRSVVDEASLRLLATDILHNMARTPAGFDNYFTHCGYQ
jgi:hypothetical protein